MQDAAYASLLNSEKRRLHAVALGHLEQKDRSASGGGPTLLASHAERGEVWDKAAQYLIGSLSQAIRSSANHEAVALYDRAVKVLARLPAETSATLAIDARLHAFSPLLALGEIDRLVTIMSEANALAHELGDKRRLAATTSQLSGVLWLAGKHEAGLQSADQAVRLADELNDFVLRLASRFNRANLLHAIGALREASDLYTAIIESLAGDLELKRFGWSGIPSILTRGFLTWSLVSLGEFERARQTKDRAMALIVQRADPYSTVYAYIGEGLYQSAMGHAQSAIAAFEAAHHITQQADIVLPIATAWLGDALCPGRPPARCAGPADGGRAQGRLPVRRPLQRDPPLHGAGPGASRRGRVAAGANRHRPRPGNRRAGRRAWPSGGGFSHPRQHRSGRPRIRCAAACACYQRAIDIARPLGLRPLIAHSLAGMAKTCEAAGDGAAAAKYRQEARRLFDELGLTDA